ncbi:hypothetical protein VTO73DRAFT_12283 [Trametes versicolor]
MIWTRYGAVTPFYRINDYEDFKTGSMANRQGAAQGIIYASPPTNARAFHVADIPMPTNGDLRANTSGAPLRVAFAEFVRI